MAKIKFRRDTAANWAQTNPILAQGEPGFEHDTGKLKLGNGTNAWTALAYTGGGAGQSDRLVNGTSELVLDEMGFLIVPASIVLSEGVITYNGEADPGIVLGSSIKSVFVRTLNGIDQYTWKFGTDGSTTLPSGQPLLFGNGNSRIQAGMGFHINSEEGISLESVNVADPANPVSYGWYFGTDGNVTLPQTAFNSSPAPISWPGITFSDGTFQNTAAINSSGPTASNGVSCLPNATTVVYTGVSRYAATIKLLVLVEGRESTSNWDTQSCEIVVAKSVRNNLVAASVYGLVYTSTAPLATFNAVWNATTLRVDVTCVPTSTTNNVVVRTIATEITTSD